LVAVMPDTKTRGSSTIQAATVTVTKFFSDDSDDEDHQSQQRRPQQQSQESSNNQNNKFGNLQIHQLQQEHSNVIRTNVSSTSPANFSKLMREFKIVFSELEYVADSLHEANEVLRRRFSSPNSAFQSDTMECLVCCSDGVFIVNPDSPQNTSKNNNTDSVQENPELLLKRLGNEKMKNARKNGEFGEKGSNNKDGSGGDVWDVVIQNQDPDRFDSGTLRSLVNSTLTLHFAELVLKRRAHLEKERLITNMKMQMSGNEGTEEEEKVAKTENGEENNEQQQEQKPKNISVSTNKSLKSELTQGYRQLELEDLRRQIETAKSHLQQQSTLSELLQEQLRSKKVALEGRRREVDEKSKRVRVLRQTSEDDLDNATKLERQLRLCRSKVLSGMAKLFPITVNAPHSICGFNIPHNEPQNEIHACALGCIVHAVITFCAVHGHVPLHPLISATSRSSVAEYVGAPANKIFPLYSTNATEREASTKGVQLLRRVMAHAAFAIHNQRQANDLPFGIALQKLLFNR
jgi:hypothetical protein